MHQSNKASNFKYYMRVANYFVKFSDILQANNTAAEPSRDSR